MHARRIAILLIWNVQVGISTCNPNANRVLVVPARQYCKDPAASIDFHLKACVHIDHTLRQLPTFFPCPSKTRLEGRYCVGEVRTEPEKGCPVTFNLNTQQQCVRADAYVPPAVLCPEGGFRLARKVETNTIQCMKHATREPVYRLADSSSRNNSRAVQDNDKGIFEMACPDGYTLRRRNNQKQGGKKTGSWQCVSRVLVPPDSSRTCLPHFAWSASLEGCLRLERAEPKTQCPRPDGDVNTRGDLMTPRYVYDATTETCASHYVPAVVPQCPPGWTLEGKPKPYCYKKLISPILYDCMNTEGFTFKWDHATGIGLCEIEFNPIKFADNTDSYQTFHDITAGQIVRNHSAATPYDILRNYQLDDNIHEAQEEVIAALFTENPRDVPASSNKRTLGHRRQEFLQNTQRSSLDHAESNNLASKNFPDDDEMEDITFSNTIVEETDSILRPVLSWATDPIRATPLTARLNATRRHVLHTNPSQLTIWSSSTSNQFQFRSRSHSPFKWSQTMQQ